jgi:hypothetical protein
MKKFTAEKNVFLKFIQNFRTSGLLPNRKNLRSLEDFVSFHSSNFPSLLTSGLRTFRTTYSLSPHNPCW